MSLAIFIENRQNDLRWAVRSLLRSPGVSALAILSLALGIGANTAIFSLVNAVLLKTLPVPSPQELFIVAARGPSPRVSSNYPDYVAFRDRAKGFSGLAAASGASSMGLQIDDGGTPGPAELVQNQFVSGNYFDVFGARPALGRLFNSEDDRALGASPFAVLGYDYWRSRFAADPRVIGRTVRLNGFPLTVIGVAARGFKGFDPTSTPSIFVPLVMHTEIQHVAAGVWNTRHYWWIRIIGRVRSGTPTAPIGAQLTSIYRSQEEEERKANPGGGVGNAGQTMYLLPAARGWSFVRNTLQTPLLVLMGVVGLVLLIACANVANIMVARGAARQREIAIRLAIGAGRLQIAMQLLTESLVVAVVGGAAGIALAFAGTRFVLGRFLPSSGWNQVSLDVSPDAAMLAFTFVVSLVAGVIAGLVPGLQAARPALVPALKDEVPGSSRRSRLLLRRLLVITQVALSLLLVIGSALFVRSLSNLRGLDAGFRREQTLVAMIDPGRNGLKGQRLRDFYERLRADVVGLPGVRSASLAAITPLAGMRWNEDFSVEGYQFKAGEQRYVDLNAVGPRYFETVGIPFLLGRDFRDEDNPSVLLEPAEHMRRPGEQEPEAPGPRVVIVTESFAKRFVAGGSPIGRRLSLTEGYDASRAYEIIGVVKDAKYFGLREAAEPMVYVPTWRGGGVQSRSLCIRTAIDAGPMTESVRGAVRRIDAAVPLISARTIEDQIDADIVQERLLATLVGFFGALALLLACIGLYGVIAYLVTRRTREIGIRLAIGATRGSVLRLVMADAVLLVGIGATLGVGAAVAMSRLVRTLLYGISPQDPATVVGCVGILLAVAMLAVVVPVRRALGVHPSVALRYE
ncbi:MAG: ABC transporter permease [Bacteroidales bacterium]